MTHTANTNCTTCGIHPKRLSLPDLFLQMLATSRQRKILRRLDCSALKDIGITRAQADVEAARPIWDVPGYWKK